MNKDTVRQSLNIVGLVVALVINALATTLPLGGSTTAQISDSFPILFVPAGYVFAIWGLIYLGLIAFSIYQALPSQRENPRLRKVGLLFFYSSLANAMWLVFFQYHQFTLALGMIVILLALLIAIYLRLEIGRVAVSPAERWLVNMPFSIYLGWLSVATIADTTQWLYFIKWNGFGIAPQIWAVILLVIGVLIASRMSFGRHDVGYALVLVWAFTGIAVKQQPVSALVGTAAWFAAAVVVIDLVLSQVLKFKTKK